MTSFSQRWLQQNPEKLKKALKLLQHREMIRSRQLGKAIKCSSYTAGWILISFRHKGIVKDYIRSSVGVLYKVNKIKVRYYMRHKKELNL